LWSSLVIVPYNIKKYKHFIKLQKNYTIFLLIPKPYVIIVIIDADDAFESSIEAFMIIQLIVFLFHRVLTFLTTQYVKAIVQDILEITPSIFLKKGFYAY